MTDFEGEETITVLIKAAPEFGRVHGNVVCVAGIDDHGRWRRLYPIPYRDLSVDQRFSRWGRISYRWRTNPRDERPESRRVDPRSLELVGEVKDRQERSAIINRGLVDSLIQEKLEGRSLALMRPEMPRFRILRKSDARVAEDQVRRNQLFSQDDMFVVKEVSREVCPYEFRYHFKIEGRKAVYRCIDWETEATFFKWRRSYGEQVALDMMMDRWNTEIPDRGVVFAFGTHRVKKYDTWLLSAVIQMPPERQAYLDL